MLTSEYDQMRKGEFSKYDHMHTRGKQGDEVLGEMKREGEKD